MSLRSGLRDHLIELGNLEKTDKPDARFILASLLLAGASLCLGAAAVNMGALLGPAMWSLGDVAIAKTFMGLTTVLAGLTGGLSAHTFTRGIAGLLLTRGPARQERPNTRYIGSRAHLIGGAAALLLASTYQFAQIPPQEKQATQRPSTAFRMAAPAQKAVSAPHTAPRLAT